MFQDSACQTFPHWARWPGLAACFLGSIAAQKTSRIALVEGKNEMNVEWMNERCRSISNPITILAVIYQHAQLTFSLGTQFAKKIWFACISLRSQNYKILQFTTCCCAFMVLHWNLEWKDIPASRLLESSLPINHFALLDPSNPDQVPESRVVAHYDRLDKSIRL